MKHADTSHRGVAPRPNTRAASRRVEKLARRRKRRKVAAILTGGVMLGVGAVVTLASWNDSEYAAGTFTAGKFNLEGSTDGSSFGEHATVGTAAALSFTSPFSNLTPTDTVYSLFSVRLAANTTTGATLAFDSTLPTTTGVVTNLTYGLAVISGTNCSSTTYTAGTSVVSDGTAVTAGANSNVATLVKGSPTTSAGAQVNLCFKVVAGSALTQGQTGTVTWNFTATSNGV